MAVVADADHGNEPQIRDYNAVVVVQEAARPLAPCDNGADCNDDEDSQQPRKMIPWTNVWNGTWCQIVFRGCV
jgi:hypothetical protein